MVELPPTIADTIAAAAASLAAAGVSDPRREALRLWSDLAGRSVAAAVMDPGAAVAAEHAARFVAAVTRRAAGEPLAYVTGWTGFRRLSLRCDRRALIPRPETEGLVDHALGRVRSGRAADIGTGTGALALALRDEGEFGAVIGIDISGAAVELAAENASATGFDVALRCGDLVAPLAGQQVDLMVSNPPYLTQAEHDSLDRSVRDYEPALALVAGNDGLELTRRLLFEARAVVAPAGWIALEADSRRAVETGRIAAATGWDEVTVLDDLFGRARYVLARRGNTA